MKCRPGERFQPVRGICALRKEIGLNLISGGFGEGLKGLKRLKARAANF